MYIYIYIYIYIFPVFLSFIFLFIAVFRVIFRNPQRDAYVLEFVIGPPDIELISRRSLAQFVKSLRYE